MESDNRVIKSYVFHKDKCFFISTIERDSSACYYPQRYNETIVWEYDWEKRERGKMIYQDGDSKGSIKNHLTICEEFYKNGEVKEKE